METLQLDITALLNSLRKAENFNDLLCLLNEVIEFQNSDSTEPKKSISRKRLTYNLKNIDTLYNTFEIPKKSGGKRIILAPNNSLKIIQRCLALLLQAGYQPTLSVNGFVPERSVVTNATIHANKKFVLNIDLENFFPNISYGRVQAVLQLKPLALQPTIAGYIAKLACYEGFLPQGAPTSPVLSNLICQRLDRRIEALVKSHKIFYTRYADDLTLSCDEPFQNGFLNHLDQIIQKEGFTLNMQKLRLQLRNSRQEVTGLTVNDKVNVSRKYLREVRAMLHNWETMGHEAAQQKFLQSYKPRISAKKKKGQPQLRNVLGGKINYLKMVRGDEDTLYQKVKAHYRSLEKGEVKEKPLSQPLPTWLPEIDHNPRRVVHFLRNFRVVNDTGFRELLHDPDTSDFDFLANLEKVNAQMPCLKSVLTPTLYRKLTTFVEAYNTAGVAYFKKHGLLPLKGQPRQKMSLLARLLLKKANMSVPDEGSEERKAVSPDRVVSKAANQFQQQIRVGSDYFQDLILTNALKPTLKALNPNSPEKEMDSQSVLEMLVEYAAKTDLYAPNVVVDNEEIGAFKPSEDEFGINCSFFTDSWEAVKAISSLIKDLVQNSLYETPDKKKQFWLRSAVIQRGTKEAPFFATVIYVHLEKGRLIDEVAFAHARLYKTKQRLWSLADWSVLYQGANGENREHYFLNSVDNQHHQAPWYDGIIHKLTFYHS